MTKFVFVTGGVVSSLGKGIASASLAAILVTRGVRVTHLKLDPYINVDPGTMSPFQHAIRQMGIILGRDNVCYIHLTLVPFIATAGEMKTKPTQHSVKELREIGIQPDVVLCRADRPLLDGDRRKIALFTNVAPDAVIPALDTDSIYKIPAALHAEGLDEIVCRKLSLSPRPADLTVWNKLVDALVHPEHE